MEKENKTEVVQEEKLEQQVSETQEKQNIEEQEKEESNNEIQEQEKDESIQEEEGEGDDEEIESEDFEQKQKLLEEQIEQVEQRNRQRGVVYLSQLPPYMTASQIRGLLEPYGIERMYLVPEDESKRALRAKKGGNKARSYVEGWVEFTDKRIARLTAESLNCSKMIKKKHNFYSEDLWHIKYLPKFKWDNLTEKFAYDAKVRKQKMQKQLQVAKKERDFFMKNKDHSKKIESIQKRMLKKKISKESNQFIRNLQQKGSLKSTIDQQEQN